MPIVTNLTQAEINKIQIDEGVLIIDYGENAERPLLPCRGGGEFSAAATVRDIEFDGRIGKTQGLQSIDDQTATLKVTVINMSQQNLAIAMPFCRMYDANGNEVPSDLTTNPAIIGNPKSGIIPSSAYLKNVTMFAKLVDGTYKKITIFRPMHENGFTVKAAQKAEGELALEFNAHYTTNDLDGSLWTVEEVPYFSLRGGSESQSNSSNNAQT